MCLYVAFVGLSLRFSTTFSLCVERDNGIEIVNLRSNVPPNLHFFVLTYAACGANPCKRQPDSCLTFTGILLGKLHQ